MKVLVADDERHIRETLAQLLSMDGFDVLTAENGLSAQRLLSEQPVDAAVLDLRMPGMDGAALLDWLTTSGPDVPVLMMSAHGDIADAVHAMKQGAADYVTKPFDPEDLVIRLRRTIEDARLRREVARTPSELHPSGALDESASPAMREVLSVAQRVAPSSSTVLITGESGTGKEVLARMIHRLSPRAGAPFVAVNMAAIPESLMESELFGHERGAFTGANQRRAGHFESASGGTLFLDEIAELPVHLQVKLLRVLQERRVQRLGGDASLPVDVRILAATNRDLQAAVREGSFREDLYYRLNVIELHLPPLRERIEDLPRLIATLLERLTTRTGRAGVTIEPDALRVLRDYHFPGNIRELENVLERAVLLSDSGRLGSRDLQWLGLQPADGSLPTGDPRPRPLYEESVHSLREMEESLIRNALLRNEGHRERTAAELGISRKTLLNKMKTYGIRGL